jgi:hypothetical protein
MMRVGRGSYPLALLVLHRGSSWKDFFSQAEYSGRRDQLGPFMAAARGREGEDLDNEQQSAERYQAADKRYRE